MHVRSWWNRVERCFADRHVAISEQTLFDSVLGRLLSDGIGAKRDTLCSEALHLLLDEASASSCVQRFVGACTTFLVCAAMSWCAQQCLGARTTSIGVGTNLLACAAVCWRLHLLVCATISGCVCIRLLSCAIIYGRVHHY